MHAERLRLVHISDVHFGAANEAALDAVAAYIKRERPDALVVAGDITQTGRRREFQSARAWLDSLDVRCLAAPGNHDTPALHLPLHIHKRVVAPFQFYERFMAGHDFVGQLVELGGGLVRIAAINTARGVQGRLNWADGVIDLDDLERALELLAGGAPDAWRLLVCHHPLREPGHSHISVDTRRGGRALQRCAAAHVDAILTGHVHDAFAHAIRGQKRPMVQMGSGTLSTRLRATHPAFCVVTIDADSILQDIVSIGPDGLDVHRNYDSRTHGAETLFRPMHAGLAQRRR